jgi:hypothetical protein
MARAGLPDEKTALMFYELEKRVSKTILNDVEQSSPAKAKKSWSEEAATSLLLNPRKPKL